MSSRSRLFGRAHRGLLRVELDEFDLRVLLDAVIEVVDHGDGVPAALQPVLFDEYTCAAGVSARGTGLGLYVVRSLAVAQGGRVSYEQAGGESLFRICLPRPRTTRSTWA